MPIFGSGNRVLDIIVYRKGGQEFLPTVNDTAPGMLGTYAVTGSALRFTPQFALDSGRPYLVQS